MTVNPAIEWLESDERLTEPPQTLGFWVGPSAAICGGTRRNGFLTEWFAHDGPDLAFAENYVKKGSL